MAKIGSLDFITIDWNRTEQGETLRTITRPGTNGVAFQRIGRKARPITARTVADYPNAADCETALVLYKQLQGTLVEIVDDLGNAFNPVAVLEVMVDEDYRVNTPSGGLFGGNYIVQATWVLMFTNVAKVP